MKLLSNNNNSQKKQKKHTHNTNSGKVGNLVALLVG